MSTKNIPVAILLVIVLGGAWYYLSINNASNPAVSEEKQFTLVVQNKKLVSGPTTITVNQGDIVTIHITNDADEELHVHGYDKSIDLQANKEAVLKFTADASGHFPYELEGSKTEIGALDVSP